MTSSLHEHPAVGRCEADHQDGGVCLAALRPDGTCYVADGHAATPVPDTDRWTVVATSRLFRPLTTVTTGLPFWEALLIAQDFDALPYMTVTVRRPTNRDRLRAWRGIGAHL